MFKKRKFLGKTALVTGAGSGIGFELALELSRQGATVIVTDILEDRLTHLLKEINQMEGKAYPYVVDHSNQDETDQFLNHVFVDHGMIDVLCCNAGVVHFGRIGEFAFDEWKRTFDINYWGQVFLINRLVPLMKKNRESWILITASGAGLFPLAGMGPYCTTKAAMVSLANVMKMELKKYNIAVSALCPGVISTNIMRSGMIQGENNQKFLIKMYDKVGVHPKKVAKAGIKGLWKAKAIIRVPLLHSAPIQFFYKFFPSLLLNIGSFLSNRGWNFIGPILK